MKVTFSTHAAKFLTSWDERNQERIRTKIKELVTSIDQQGIIPFRELQIKMLAGKWKGFMRMRIGKIRIIFRIDKEKQELLVYAIDFRGKVYR
jgi:mRNA interferase RelE/StbE